MHTNMSWQTHMCPHTFKHVYTHIWKQNKMPFHCLWVFISDEKSSFMVLFLMYPSSHQLLWRVPPPSPLGSLTMMWLHVVINAFSLFNDDLVFYIHKLIILITGNLIAIISSYSFCHLPLSLLSFLGTNYTYICKVTWYCSTHQWEPFILFQLLFPPSLHFWIISIELPWKLPDPFLSQFQAAIKLIQWIITSLLVFYSFRFSCVFLYFLFLFLCSPSYLLWFFSSFLGVLNNNSCRTTVCELKSFYSLLSSLP